MPVEHEVKLSFESFEAARRAVIAAGGRLVVSRRLLVDDLFDTPDARLKQGGCALRLRRDGARAFLTFKGPAQPGPVKSREEHETGVASPEVTEQVIRGLGFAPFFHAEKFREEFTIDGAVIAVDEAPIGVFVEVEADPAAIERVTRLLGRTPADYRLESYQRLYADWCRNRGGPPDRMTFEISPCSPPSS